MATELADYLKDRPGSRALVLGAGNGRNLPPLLAAGARVDAVEDDPQRARDAMLRLAGTERVRIARAGYAGPYPFTGPFDGALATSALLHGTPAFVAAALAAAANRLLHGAPFYFTLGSKRDPRYRQGRRVADDAYESESGSEAGIVHSYFDEPAIRTLAGALVLTELEERPAAPGAWAHTPTEAAAIIHWFIRAHRP